MVPDWRIKLTLFSQPGIMKFGYFSFFIINKNSLPTPYREKRRVIRFYSCSQGLATVKDVSQNFFWNINNFYISIFLWFLTLYVRTFKTFPSGHGRESNPWHLPNVHGSFASNFATQFSKTIARRRKNPKSAVMIGLINYIVYKRESWNMRWPTEPTPGHIIHMGHRTRQPSCRCISYKKSVSKLGHGHIIEA